MMDHVTVVVVQGPSGVPQQAMTGHTTVNVAQGALRGRKTTTKSGGPLHSFQGIPYAQPPVGELRFKAPLPLEPWSGIKSALKEGSSCPHYHMFNEDFIGNEDCLFINVYTPKVPSGSSGLLPVMAWIHGGGFMQGSGDTDLYGPDYLVDAGVVVVTFNYRLGPLGFLCLEDELVPGNAGLKDQVAALRWVQQNIANFGGDPDNVTIFGESAGGVSVHYHMLSPMSKGLFRRAITQSGWAIGSWALAHRTRARAFQLGEALGCQTEDVVELLDWLRQATPQQLVDSVAKAMTKEDKTEGVLVLFVPCVEKPVDGEEAFLMEDPSKLLSEGRFHRVPFITGVNSHEGLLVIKGAVNSPSQLAVINRNFERIIPRNLNAELGSQRAGDIARRIKKFYFGDSDLSQETLMEYVHMNSDLHFMWDMHNTVRAHASHGSAPVFCYKFSFDGVLNLLKPHVGAAGFPGACHGDDLGYLFLIHSKDVDVDRDSPEMKTIERMVEMWTNFAKTGNPTPDGSSVGVTWAPFSLANPVYLHINSELTMEKHLEKERMDFWEQIYKLK